MTVKVFQGWFCADWCGTLESVGSLKQLVALSLALLGRKHCQQYRSFTTPKRRSLLRRLRKLTPSANLDWNFEAAFPLQKERSWLPFEKPLKVP